MRPLDCQIIRSFVRLSFYVLILWLERRFIKNNPKNNINALFSTRSFDTHVIARFVYASYSNIYILQIYFKNIITYLKHTNMCVSVNIKKSLAANLHYKLPS